MNGKTYLDWRLENGATLQETANHFGISIAAVCSAIFRYRKAHAEKPVRSYHDARGRRPNHPAKHTRALEYEAMLAIGRTVTDIANHFGVSHQAVRQALSSLEYARRYWEAPAP
jgi:DNA-binding CsgD family transcriptional regulator